MRKYMVMAKGERDIIALMRDTKSVDLGKVKWNWTGIGRSNDDANCENECEVVAAVESGDFSLVDDMLMGGDVSVGSMVIVTNGEAPRYGFVCANGSDWIAKKLKVRESNAIVYSIFSGRRAK